MDWSPIYDETYFLLYQAIFDVERTRSDADWIPVVQNVELTTSVFCSGFELEPPSDSREFFENSGAYKYLTVFI